MSDDRYEEVEIEVDNLKAQTEKAGLFVIDGEEVWLPWSQIGGGSNVTKNGESGVICIPRWLAEEKGLD